MERKLRSPSAFIGELRKLFARNAQSGVFLEAGLCADLAEALDNDIEAIRWMERVTARTHADDPGRPPRLSDGKSGLPDLPLKVPLSGRPDSGRTIAIEAAGPNVFLFPLVARRPPTTGGSAA